MRTSLNVLFNAMTRRSGVEAACARVPGGSARVTKTTTIKTT